MHAEIPPHPSLKLSAERMTLAAQRDLVEYWARRKFEGRPHDWT